MSVAGCTITGMEKETWNKYSFVCDPNECDTLIEVTCGPFDWPNGVVKITCPCGRNMQFVSVEHATITQPNERKEMFIQEDSQQVVALQALIQTLEGKNESLKTQIENDSVKYNTARSQINKIIDNLTTESWYNKSTDKETVLEELCEIIDHEPKATLRFSATIIVDGSIDIPMSDVDDYDIRYALQDELNVDSYNGDMEINSFDVDHVSQDWE